MSTFARHACALARATAAVIRAPRNALKPFLRPPLLLSAGPAAETFLPLALGQWAVMVRSLHTPATPTTTIAAVGAAGGVAGAQEFSVWVRRTDVYGSQWVQVKLGHPPARAEDLLAAILAFPGVDAGDVDVSRVLVRRVPRSVNRGTCAPTRAAEATATVLKLRGPLSTQRVSNGAFLLVDVINATCECTHESPLHEAAFRGDVKGIVAAVAAGADPRGATQGEGDVISARCTTPPLLTAAEGGSPAAIHALLRAGARVTDMDGLKRQAIHIAAWHGQVSAIHTLLSAGASITARSMLGDAPLDFAAMFRQHQAVQALLAAGANPNLPGTAPLGYAAQKGDLATMRVLMAAGAAVNPADPMLSPLFLALAGGHMPAIRLLMDAGAQINVRVRKERTLLHWAAREGSLKALLILLRAGAELNPSARHGARPLHYAAMTGNVDVVAALVAAGAQLDVQCTINKTPLHWACTNGHVRVVELLLAAGASAIAVSEDGQTALHVIASIGKSYAYRPTEADMVRCIELLLEAGCDPNVRDDDGSTALEIAKTRSLSYPELIQALRRATA